MKQLINLMMIIVVILISLSCGEIDDDKPDYHYGVISESLYPLLFNAGSFWVYNNNLDTDIDSVALTGIRKDTIYLRPRVPGQGSLGEEEFYNLTYESSEFGETEEQLVGYIISEGNINGGYKYLSSHEIGDERSSARISNIHDSLLINENYYFNVVEMDVAIDNYLDTEMNLYYVDSIGVVRKEIKDDGNIIETWDLLRYNVSFLGAY